MLGVAAKGRWGGVRGLVAERERRRVSRAFCIFRFYFLSSFFLAQIDEPHDSLYSRSQVDSQNALARTYQFRLSRGRFGVLLCLRRVFSFEQPFPPPDESLHIPAQGPDSLLSTETLDAHERRLSEGAAASKNADASSVLPPPSPPHPLFRRSLSFSASPGSFLGSGELVLSRLQPSFLESLLYPFSCLGRTFLSLSLSRVPRPRRVLCSPLDRFFLVLGSILRGQSWTLVSILIVLFQLRALSSAIKRKEQRARARGEQLRRSER